MHVCGAAAGRELRVSRTTPRPPTALFSEPSASPGVALRNNYAICVSPIRIRCDIAFLATTLLNNLLVHAIVRLKVYFIAAIESKCIVIS